MKRPVSILISASALLAIVWLPPGVRGDDPESWLDFLDEDTYEAAGLHKLSEDEREVLAGVLLPAGGPSFLEPEAVAFMERAGWRPVSVAGAIEDGSERRVILLDGDGPVLAEAWSSIEPLPPPGVHWARGSAGSWDILNPDGTSHHFTDP